MRTHTTLVINPKGGSGKTTVATNLASYFAANKVATALMDYDPQGSSLNWLRQRPVHLPRIHGANAAPAKPGRMRSLDMRVPEDTHQLVIDAPAAERQQFMPVADWVETPKLIVDSKAPSLPPFHPAMSVPGRSALRVVTKGFPAS